MQVTWALVKVARNVQYYNNNLVYSLLTNYKRTFQSKEAINTQKCKSEHF